MADTGWLGWEKYWLGLTAPATAPTFERGLRFLEPRGRPGLRFISGSSPKEGWRLSECLEVNDQ